MPSYDFNRGEPRGKLRKSNDTVAQQGDCIDCYQCVQVCPTGVDIRQGHQLGCITCGLCIDACNSVMDKIGAPRGLIRYASPDEIEGKPLQKRYRNPWIWVYSSILLASGLGVIYGLSHMSPVTLSVRPERQPLFVRMSDGTIQNKYELKIMNKTDRDIQFSVTAKEGIRGQTIVGLEKAIFMPPGRVTSLTVFVKVPEANILREVMPITFHVEGLGEAGIVADYNTQFNGPTF
jgi:cytochrome c oxidase accessory protein FixG